MSISKFMTTPLGTFIKAFAVAMLSLIMARQKDGTLCFDKNCIVDILISSTFAIIPVVINWINPHYTQYGEGADEPTLTNTDSVEKPRV